ncbi:MAG: IS5/IS1182 family transposase, partial [Pseudomonadota bacterium]
MRGADITQESLFTTVQLEAFVLTHHPLRGKRELIDTALNRLNWLFDSAYADLGRASIAPERLLRP